MRRSILYITILLLTGCTKLIEVKAPVDQLVTSTIFQDSATAHAAISGLYAELYNAINGNGAGSIFAYRITTLPARSADELTPLQNTFDNFYTNSLVPTDPDVSEMWSMPYTFIYYANSVIEGLDGSSLSATLKQQLTAEAKFARAFCYFYLVNYFGKVPLITVTKVSETNMAPAAEVQDVYAQIVKDLTDARDGLAADYSWSGGDRTRVNASAASALLARVYLYLGKWSDAEAEASKVIANTQLYTLLTDPSKVFLANSREAIWQFYSNANGFTYAARQLVATGVGVPSYELNEHLYHAFEPDDLRKKNWVDSVNVLGTWYTYPAKYKSVTPTNTEYETVLRLAEQYLIRAEARAQQEKTGDAQADLDAIRARAGLPPTTAGDKASLLPAIEHERQVELFCEWGHRWLDLKRTGRADAVLGTEKAAGWQSTDVLYPVPQAAINTNTNLHQNEGYH
jgi:hypothetical protein